MKDSILNTTLSTFILAAVLIIAFDRGDMTPQTAIAQSNAVVTIEKTVITASRLAS
jgi:hypothetical protein